MAFNGGPTGTFWTQSPGRDPKRSFRFKVEFGQSGPLWYAKKADKPTLSFGESTHQYLNHTYYWPARAEWNEVTITLVDPVQPDLAGDLVSSLEAMGYFIPAGTTDTEFQTPSKAKAVAELGGGTTGDSDDVRIIQIDEDGTAVETWTLKHAWIKEVTFGDLDYGSEDLTEVTIKFRYDWASFQSGAPDSPHTQPAFTV
tara:strand:+ start:515 stop:1111 length:597 start_codon:yes stop_codon:yes gene_type:complete